MHRHLNVDGPSVLRLSSAQPTVTITDIKPYSTPSRQLESLKGQLELCAIFTSCPNFEAWLHVRWKAEFCFNCWQEEI